jgi:O-antigen/teichoic acid export membrane protein
MFKNLIWDLAGKTGVNLVLILVSLVLTRLLEPREFGIAGIAMVLIFFSSLFLDLGFNKALIQQKDINQETYSSVFWLNALLAVFFSLMFFLLSGPVSVFFKYPELSPVLKVLAIPVIFNGLSLLPSAILNRQMKFRQLSFAGIISAIISGAAGIFLAIKGYGVWSLVIQYVIACFIGTGLYFYFAKWKPKFITKPNIRVVRPLWIYGSRLFFSSLLNSFVTRLDVFIIAKYFNVNTLGFYTRAQSIDNLLRTISSGSITSVFFAAAARLQDERNGLLILYKRYLHVISFAAVGLAGLFYLIVPDLFRFLFTAKWDTAARYFQLMSVIGFAWPVSSLMVSVISGVGNSKAFLNVEIIKTLILLSALTFLFTGGIVFFLWMMVGVRLILVCCNAYFVSKELAITVWNQLKVVFIYLSLALIAVIIIKLVFSFSLENSNLLNAAILFSAYGFLYISFQFIFKTNASREMVSFYQKLFLERTALR